MKKYNVFEDIGADGDERAHSTQPNGEPAVFCTDGCCFLAVALVNDVPLCIKCLRRKLLTVSLKRVEIRPISDFRHPSEQLAESSEFQYLSKLEVQI